MKIFISHSHKNRDAAKALVDFLLSGLSLEDADIRCTSVPGHQLRFGKTIAELLKGDIDLAPAIIALISAESQRADWVLFELGAAWGLGKAIFPILGPGIEIRELPGPLGTLPCVIVEANDASIRMSDLMQQLHEDLGVASKSGGRVQANLDAFLNCYKKSSKQGSQANEISPKCIEGPTYSKGYVSLRVAPVLPECWFVAVSRNRPDAVWVQRLDRPDTEGRLRLEAYGFKGRYGVYAACDDETINRLRELQAQAANGNAATLHDMPTGALQICMNDAK